MDNKELATLIYSFLTEYPDVYNGDVALVLDDICEKTKTVDMYNIDQNEDVYVITGEFTDGEPIDIRVTKKPELLVEAFDEREQEPFIPNASMSRTDGKCM